MKASGFIFVFLLLGYPFAMAQDNSDPNSTSTQVEAATEDAAAIEKAEPGEATQSEVRNFEKIEVTGSHIKRIDVEGPSPLMVIDKDDLVRSGYNSVSDVLRDTGINSFGSFRERAGQIGAGTAAVNLRGLGQVRTLVLLDGQRLPTDAINGAVDLNIIPMAAVERVEILMDGASAIYGSDALGGVVNIITKKDFSGHELGGMFSVPEMPGGSRTDFSHTYGYNTDRFRLINVAFFRHNERMLAQDRPWSERGFSTIGSPGSYSLVGEDFYKPDPACPAELQISGRCNYNFAEESWEIPYISQGSLMNGMSYDISDSLTVTSRLTYSFKQTDWNTAPAFANFTDSATDPFSFTAPAELGADAGQTIDQLRYRLVELGLRKSHTDTHAGMAVLGLKGYLFDTWDWQTNASYSKVDRTEIRRGYIRKSDFISLLQSGDFNPFAAAGQRGDLQPFLYDPRFQSISENTMVEAKAAGEIGNWGAGPVSLAVGMMGLRELYNDTPDDVVRSGDTFGLANSAGGGDRNSVSLFTELAAQPLETLESSFALRYDNFEGFGDTINPKLAFRYLPYKELMFRASTGTGFKAPQMQRLFSAQTAGFSPFKDEVWCQASGGTDPNACLSQQQPIISGGNPDLKEETSFSYNLGTVIQPTRHHSFSLDFWYYQLNDVVQPVDFIQLTQLEAQGVDIGKYGATAERDPVTKQLVNNGLFAPFLNVAGIETQGLDFSYKGKIQTSIGDFRLQVMHSHMFYFRQELLEGTGVVDQIGILGRPQWRNNTTLFWIPNPKHETSILARTLGSHNKATPSRGRHYTYTEFDLRHNWTVESWQGKFTFGIRNLLGSIPPFDDSNPLDPDLFTQLYNERGRQLFISYRQTF